MQLQFSWTDTAKCFMVPGTPPSSDISWFLNGHYSNKDGEVQSIKAAGMTINGSASVVMNAVYLSETYYIHRLYQTASEPILT